MKLTTFSVAKTKDNYAKLITDSESSTKINVRSGWALLSLLLLATLKMPELYNFADDNTISTASKNMNNLIHTLEKESETAVEWFNQNKIIVNPDKFQAMLLEKRNENDQSCLKIHTVP